jgi:uncharacterized membrane protein YagU involved in acid resistance
MVYREYIHTPVTQRDMWWGLRQGAIAGIVAGIVFAAFEMIVSAAMMGGEAFFMPLRMIGAIALGPDALDPAYSLVTASVGGVIVHLVLAIIYGVIFGEIAAMLRGPVAFIGAGSIFGLALWLINFYVIAPAFFPWFLEASPLVQFVAHTFFFGSVLGFYLWKSHQRSGLEEPVNRAAGTDVS